MTLFTSPFWWAFLAYCAFVGAAISTAGVRFRSWQYWALVLAPSVNYILGRAT